MLVEFRVVFTNKDNRYPKTIPDMIDFMQKISEKKRKPNNPKPPGKWKYKEK